MLPARRPLYSAPWACAASSMTDEAVALGDLEDRVHVGRLAVEVDRQDRLGPRRDRGFDHGRVDRERDSGSTSTNTGRRAGSSRSPRPSR